MQLVFLPFGRGCPLRFGLVLRTCLLVLLLCVFVRKPRCSRTSNLTNPHLLRAPVMFFWRLRFVLLMDIPWCLWIVAQSSLDSFVLLLLLTFQRILALLS